MKVNATPIQGVFMVETTPSTDPGETFPQFFNAGEMVQAVGSRAIIQVNFSMTNAKGAIRGLHFQKPPHAEIKMVRCLKGSVFDVAVDLRKGSPTFLQWHAEELSGDNRRMLVIPEGCAHGFQTLEPFSELLYFHTHPYTREAEGGFRHDDPSLGIRWPLPATDLSERDKNHPLITRVFTGIAL
jgi:dTDP-4-dehydrorhamnose 3,5-epimerase